MIKQLELLSTKSILNMQNDCSVFVFIPLFTCRASAVL